MIVEHRIDEKMDLFPVGMRVLAVDDDPICLRLLDTLLRKCQYHVTTTSQAVVALEMLRENRYNFDLVISDVHMPDMDGFKLLELVGLEMDLPVIMLSAYGDTKLVMKGISHGACDYLLKPVRIEELKNIWQHVIRRKKFDPKDQKDFDKPHGESGEAGEGFTGTGDPDQNGKLNRKRKDQNDDDDEDRDENGHNTEDPSSQKKPRVVWSVELHRKFVSAVNQLGIDKAVPKRILDMMNVDKLTRENVASHLQKYRLYLKRISCVASQQANMVAALGSADSAYLQMASLNGLGNIHTLAGSGQFQNAAFRSFSPSSVLGRLNTPAGLAMRSLSSSGMVQLTHAQNSSNAINGLNNFHSLIQPGNQTEDILQGMPMSLELDQLQHNQGVTHIGELSATTDSMVYPVSSGLSDTIINVGNSSNSHFVVFEGHLQDVQRRSVFGNQSSVTGNPLNVGFPSHLPDFERCNNNWPSAVQSSHVESNSYTLSDCFKRTNTSDFRDDIPSMAMHMETNHHDHSSTTSLPAQLPDTRTDFLQCQAAPASSNVGQIMKFSPRQVWDENKQDAPHQSNLLRSSMNSSMPHGVAGPFNQRLDPKNTTCHMNNGFNWIGQSNFVDPLPVQHNEVGHSAMETALKLKHRHLKDQNKPQGSYANNSVDSLEELVSMMMKQERGLQAS